MVKYRTTGNPALMLWLSREFWAVHKRNVFEIESKSSGMARFEALKKEETR